MGRLKTDKERKDKQARQRKERKISKGNPYVQTEIDPVDINTLTPKAMNLVLKNMKRGWITRNSQCPCNSKKRFKNCCMETI